MLYLRHHEAADNIPISIVRHANSWIQICTEGVTKVLHAEVRAAGPYIGIAKAEISVHSLRAGGAMAHLIGRIDPDIIRLVGRRRSNMML